MTDTPQSNTPSSSAGQGQKRNKRWRRFRQKKNRPQLTGNHQQGKPLPQQGQAPQGQSQRKPFQKPQQKPQGNTSPQKPSLKPGSGLDFVKRSQAREILPPDYRLPEDLDIPTYVFGQDQETPPQGETQEVESPENQPVCPICHYPIKKFYTTVRHPSHDALVHFDCALRELFQQHKSRLARDQRIYYIGGGRFAIVKEIRDKRGNVKDYQIIEKIEYEKHT